MDNPAGVNIGSFSGSGIANSGTISTTNNTEAAGNDRTRQSIRISFSGTSIQINKWDITEDELRMFFPDFPERRAMLLKNEDGDLCSVARFHQSSLITCRTLSLQVGGNCGGFAEERSNIQPTRRSGVFDDDSAFLQRPPRPSPFGTNSTPRGRPSAVTRTRSCYVRVKRGELDKSGKFVPAEDRITKNVLLHEQDFSYFALMESVLNAFNIPMEDRNNFHLADRRGGIVTSDEGTESFTFWTEKRKYGAEYYLTEKLPARKRRRNIQGDDSGQEGISTGGSGTESTTATAGGVSTITSTEHHIRRFLTDNSFTDSYHRQLQTDMRVHEIERMQNEVTTLQGQEEVGTEEPTYEGILRPLHCLICTKTMNKPQQCPQCRMVWGGRICVLTWFLTEMQQGRSKRCMLCNKDILDTITERNLDTVINNAKKYNLGLQFCGTD